MSKKFLIAGLVALVAFINVWLAKSISPTVQVPESLATDVADYLIATKPLEETNSTSSPTYLVTNVVDGDTIDIEINGVSKRVRYIGIDTPELMVGGKEAECFSSESTQRNRQLVMGKEVRLVKDISEVDQYGRLLRYVYVGEEFINVTLLQEGYAKAVTFPPDVSKSDILLATEKKAKQEGNGLWGSICAQRG